MDIEKLTRRRRQVEHPFDLPPMFTMLLVHLDIVNDEDVRR
jgi:hypothetical protein